MNPKNTWLLLALAALLGGFIFAWDRFVVQPANAPVYVLPGFNSNAVTSILIRAGNHPELLAERTNGGWQLAKPLVYKARSDKVDELLYALTVVQPDRFFSARDLSEHPETGTGFGFEEPSASLTIFSGSERKQVLIGARTAPGDQVFVQVVGIPGVHLVTTNLLAYLPQSATDWRDGALLDWQALAFDRVLVNVAARTMELQRNPTNSQWRLVRQKARADSALVNGLIAELEALKVAQFVTDNPQADLDTYGLQTPDLEIIFANGTNKQAALQFGKSLTNDTSLVYARRAGGTSVWTVPVEALKAWRSPAAEFYDRHLATITSIPQSIEVIGQDHFTLTHVSNVDFRVSPQNFTADTNYTPQFIIALAKLQVERLVRDAVIESALTNYGLANPQRQYNIQTSGTNAAAFQLMFGSEKDGLVYARRKDKDEDSVYTVKQPDLAILPNASWELRDRRIWNFSEDDVVRVVIERGGRKRELVRKGTNDWSVANFPNATINDGAVEDAVHRCGDLVAAFWTARGQFDRATYGFTNPVNRLTFELKDSSKREVEFGGLAPSQFPYATVTLGGEPVVFEFPWGTYQIIGDALRIPILDGL